MARTSTSRSTWWRRALTAGGPPRPPRTSRVGASAPAITGCDPSGRDLSVEVAADPGEVVLAFLTSSCQGCREIWDHLDEPVSPPAGATSARLVVVTPGPALETRSRVEELAPPDATVVMSAQAWTDYDVTGSPFTVVVRDGRVAAERPLSGWSDLQPLLRAAT